MTWYISDLARYRSEREGLAFLAQRAEWLSIGRWRLDANLRLIVDADITIGDRLYPIYLQFPEYFPHTPPSVFPRGESGRWSSHQFGDGGELCLEFGPDTWTPDLTGSHLVESTHRLLEGENPSPSERGVVASRHALSTGVKLRGKYSRMLLTRNVEAMFPTLPLLTPMKCTTVSMRHKECNVQLIYKIEFVDGTEWIDKDIPAQLLEEAYERLVPLLRISPEAVLPPTGSYQEFRAACEAWGMAWDGNYVLILKGDVLHPYFVWEEENKARKISVIRAQPEEQRLDAAHATLKARSVALVGCGSVGSKVATMLARAGVGRFLLVDDDILLPDNFVRNDLDWRDAGAHKAEALARKLQLVNTSVETKAWRARLGGQEASESAEAALKLIIECNLIFDATANSDILNLLSAVASASSKTVMWAEVFGGGIGGLIARCRPGVEPPPQYTRRAIESWFGERGLPPVRPSRSYATGGDGPPLIADDADVSVIAAHAARLVIDTLIGREPSLFPNSVYAIGLGAGSVFSQPFETWPIELGPPPESQPVIQLSPDEIGAEIATIVNLYSALAHETDTSTPDNRTSQE